MDERHAMEEQDEARTAAALQRAAQIMARLRAPGGCAWDRAQTFDSIKRYTLEETYEVFDAIERRAWPELKDELGDLLLQVLFYAQMAREAGYFDLCQVAENLSEKLVRRHPHVFADTVAADPDAVLRNWEKIKAQERQSRPAASSLLDQVPRTMPATMEAEKLGSKAAKVGFDWPSAEGLFQKLAEETAELRAEMERDDKPGMEAEFGDLLFTMMNLARHLKIDAESALRGSNARFRTRFAAMERASGGAESLATLEPQHLEDLWAQAKDAERLPPEPHKEPSGSEPQMLAGAAQRTSTAQQSRPTEEDH
ncbi:MAG: nucleoside triphosphate pyrophosphohydrolase [Acidobacteriaceae bacterium]